MFDHHVFLEVGEHPAVLFAQRWSAQDPQDRAFAARGQLVLDDLAVATQHPDFVAALGPTVGSVRPDLDRGVWRRLRQNDLRPGRGHAAPGEPRSQQPAGEAPTGTAD
jgi:hypothetical protein